MPQCLASGGKMCKLGSSVDIAVWGIRLRVRVRGLEWLYQVLVCRLFLARYHVLDEMPHPPAVRYRVVDCPGAQRHTSTALPGGFRRTADSLSSTLMGWRHCKDLWDLQLRRLLIPYHWKDGLELEIR